MVCLGVCIEFACWFYFVLSICADEFEFQEVLFRKIVFSVVVFLGFSLDYLKNIVRNDGGKHICIDLPAMPQDPMIPFIIQHIMYSVLFEPAAVVIDPFFRQCRHDVLHIYASRILGVDIPHDFRLILIDDDLLINNLITVQDAPAGIVAFCPGLTHTAPYLLGQLCRIVFRHAF